MMIAPMIIAQECPSIKELYQESGCCNDSSTPVDDYNLGKFCTDNDRKAFTTRNDQVTFFYDDTWQLGFVDDKRAEIG